MLEDRADAAAIGAFLGMDREGTRHHEAGVSGSSLGLVGLERLVLAAARHGPQGQHAVAAEPLQVACHQVRFLDGEKRREQTRDDPAALDHLPQPQVDGLQRLVHR